MSYLDIPQICQNEKDGDILAAKKEMKLADEEDFGNRFVSLEDLFYLSEKNIKELYVKQMVLRFQMWAVKKLEGVMVIMILRTIVMMMI